MGGWRDVSKAVVTVTHKTSVEKSLGDLPKTYMLKCKAVNNRMKAFNEYFELLHKTCLINC